MENPRSRRPPDVEEALFSILWTPYEQSASSDSSTDEEIERKAKRYSNPLPNSCNWWTGNNQVQNPVTMRYSFPYYGNYLPLSYPNNNEVYVPSSNNNSATTSNMVHSFTDDFLQYQVKRFMMCKNVLTTFLTEEILWLAKREIENPNNIHFLMKFYLIIQIFFVILLYINFCDHNATNMLIKQF